MFLKDFLKKLKHEKLPNIVRKPNLIKTKLMFGVVVYFFFFFFWGGGGGGVEKFLSLKCKCIISDHSYKFHIRILSVTSKSMCMKYWFTASSSLPRKSVVR